MSLSLPAPRRHPWRSAAILLALAAIISTPCLMLMGSAKAVTTVDVPGELEVSIDTAANSVGPVVGGVFTPLTTQPVLTLGDVLAVGDTFALVTPTGWSFDTSTGDVTMGGGAGCTLSAPVRTATAITYTVETLPCTPGDTITWSNVAVQPDNGFTSAAGDLSFVSTVSGADNSNVGTLTGLPGEAIVLHVLSASTGGVAGGDIEVTVAARDQFGNQVASYAGSKNLTFSGPGTSPLGDDPSH